MFFCANSTSIAPRCSCNSFKRAPLLAQSAVRRLRCALPAPPFAPAFASTCTLTCSRWCAEGVDFVPRLGDFRFGLAACGPKRNESPPRRCPARCVNSAMRCSSGRFLAGEGIGTIAPRSPARPWFPSARRWPRRAAGAALPARRSIARPPPALPARAASSAAACAASVCAFARAFRLLRRQAVDLINDGLDLLRQHARGIFQRLEFALARGDGHFLRAQLRLRLLQSSLQAASARSATRPFCRLISPTLSCNAPTASRNSAIWFLRPEDGRRRLAGAVPVQIAAREDAVPVEQFARGRDEVERPIGRPPGAPWPPPDRARSTSAPAAACNSGRTDASASITLNAPTALAGSHAERWQQVNPLDRRQMQRRDAGAAGFGWRASPPRSAAPFPAASVNTNCKLCPSAVSIATTYGSGTRILSASEPSTLPAVLSADKRAGAEPFVLGLQLLQHVEARAFLGLPPQQFVQLLRRLVQLLLYFAQTLLPVLHRAAMRLRV